jgi:hypothetical protein
MAGKKQTKRRAAVDGWVNELIDAKGYSREVRLAKERWVAIG